MTTPPPLDAPPSAAGFQVRKDREHMRLLAIFHFVHAGLALLGILFICLHYFIMSSVFLNPKLWENAQCPDELHVEVPGTVESGSAPAAEAPRGLPNDSLITPHEEPGETSVSSPSHGPDPEFFKEFFKIFVWFYIFAGVMIAAALVLNILSGIYLLKRKHRIFSLVVAGFNCLNMPLGTLLGVFTIMVLTRDSVRQSYEPQ